MNPVLTLLCMILIPLLILLILLFLLAWYLPMRKAIEVTDFWRMGSFGEKIEFRFDFNGELSHLANTLNYMASELSTLEEDQKEFISNVSHDFRSPLTSIKGYVEAVLDGTIPPEKQEKYLKIILAETERLSKLTESILLLNKFGAHGSVPNPESFDLHEMIETVVRSFEGVSAEKKVGIELNLWGEDLAVTADKSEIQQVLYNLIDNALKFSPERTTITVGTRSRNGKAFISVKDQGIGIPKDSLNKIWDRFYKTDLSRGKDKRGSGLGLSIVKKIIQSHNEHIDVVSTEGVGTEFIFSLPLSKQSK